jgi:hypothetical protein
VDNPAINRWYNETVLSEKGLTLLDDINFAEPSDEMLTENEDFMA